MAYSVTSGKPAAASAQAMPRAVAAAFDAYAPAARATLLELRRLVFQTAAGDQAVGPLTETLKWGEPAYLTLASGSGSTIRLGVPRSAPRRCAIYFNCRTTLVEDFRAQFSGDLAFAGNRAILLDPGVPLPLSALSACLLQALTYHLAQAPAARLSPARARRK